MTTVRRYWPLPVALLLFICGLLLTLPLSHPFRENLRDLGGAIGGFWALAAGLLAYFATIYGINKQIEKRRREVAAVCLSEIRATWALLEKMTVIERLQESSRKIRELKNAADKSSLNALCYRGSPGGSWLCLQSSNPEAFGVLPHNLAQQATSHYSRLRNVIGRLNWMNGESFGSERYTEVLGRQEDTEAELRELKGDTKEFLLELDRQTRL